MQCLTIARRQVSDQALAEDVAQEAALRAWRYRSGLIDASKRDAWLGAIVRNESARYSGSSRDLPLDDDALAALRVAEDWRPAADLRLDLGRAVEQLSRADQELVLLRYQEDLTQAEIAKRLAIPLGTVKVRLHRARKLLRLHLR